MDWDKKMDDKTYWRYANVLDNAANQEERDKIMSDAVANYGANNDEIQHLEDYHNK